MRQSPRREPGWQAAIDPGLSNGLYHIVQQPASGNDYTLIVRVDDEWTPYDNSTELVVWEVPAP